MKCCLLLSALVLAAASAEGACTSSKLIGTPRIDRTKFHIGAYCIKHPALHDEEHVRAIRDCGLDFLYGVPVTERKLLDLFAKYDLGCIVEYLFPSWWGGCEGMVGNMDKIVRPLVYEAVAEKFRRDLDHPAIWMLNVCDEPNALDMPYLGRVARLVAEKCPETPAFANLFPNYASVCTNGAEAVKSQLGTATYAEHVEAYCRNVPLDYISYDHYMMRDSSEETKGWAKKAYDNFRVVADACRRTGRDFWYAPQVNSYPHSKLRQTENKLRYQAYTAMAFGCTLINWACWSPGWWDHNVYDENGVQDRDRYETLKKVNFEIRRIAEPFMRYRNVATWFVGFEGGDDAYADGCFDALKATDGSPVLVGDMKPRKTGIGDKALFVFAAGDPTDELKGSHVITFRAKGDVEAIGQDGALPVARSADGSCSFTLADNACALLVHKTPSAFGAARWIWPTALGACPTNTVVEFRQAFQAEKDGAAKLAIAADTVCQVRLNGKTVVETLRFPDVPPHRLFDELDVSGVRKGMNELSVSLYVQGIDSFQHLSGDPGLMYRLSGEGVLAESGTATEWRLCRAARAEGVPRVTPQLGFSFEYDATRPEESWRRIGCADAGRSASDFFLTKRNVPRVEVLPAVRETLVGQGVLDGSALEEEPAPGMDHTKMTPVEKAVFYDGNAVKANYFKDGFYVLADLGREEAGLLFLDVDTDAGVVIDIGHAEHMEDGRIRAENNGRNFAGRYRARAGRQTFCQWERRMAGRYLQLHVRGVKTHFSLNRLTVLPTLVPLTERAVPKLADRTSEDIYRISVRTLRLCLHEHYEDCPWREQALYANDSRNQMLAGYYAFADDGRLPELSLALLEKGLGEDGWIELCMPTRFELTIPSFTFCWVLAVGDNLKYRKNVGFTRTMMPAVKKILDMRLTELEDGILPCAAGERYWHFYEWVKGFEGQGRVAPGEKRFDAPLNLFFILALESGATCAQACGDRPAAERWRTAAAALRERVRNKFWDPTRKEFVTRLGGGVPAAELVQSLALLAKAVPPDAEEALVKKLSEPSDWLEVSLSQSLYKYEALIAEGGEAARQAVKTMTAIWKRMLDAGATSFWEVAEGWPAFQGAGSLCHGWSAVPAYIYGAHPDLCTGK